MNLSPVNSINGYWLIFTTSEGKREQVGLENAGLDNCLPWWRSSKSSKNSKRVFHHIVWISNVPVRHSYWDLHVWWELDDGKDKGKCKMEHIVAPAKRVGSQDSDGVATAGSVKPVIPVACRRGLCVSWDVTGLGQPGAGAAPQLSPPDFTPSPLCTGA